MVLVHRQIANGHITITAAAAAAVAIATVGDFGLIWGGFDGVTYFAVWDPMELEVVSLRVEDRFVENPLQCALGAVWDKVPVRFTGIWIVNLLLVVGLQEKGLAHTHGGVLQTAPLLANAPAEQQVTKREVEEDILQ